MRYPLIVCIPEPRTGSAVNDSLVREPYQVLLDSQLIIDAARFKMHLGKMLENTLLGTIKPMFVYNKYVLKTRDTD